MGCKVLVADFADATAPGADIAIMDTMVGDKTPRPAVNCIQQRICRCLQCRRQGHDEECQDLS